MLESVIIAILMLGFVTLVISIEKENIIYSFLSLLFWIILMAGQLYITSSSDATAYTSEPFLIPVSIGMIMINIIWEIILYFDMDFWRQHRF